MIAQRMRTKQMATYDELMFGMVWTMSNGVTKTDELKLGVVVSRMTNAGEMAGGVV